jgi:hypothetical protein
VLTRKVYASRVIAASAILVLGLLVLNGTAKADINLITNGGFETTSGITTSNEILNCGTLADWCSSDGTVDGNVNGKYNYVYFPGYVTPSDPHGAFTTQQPTQFQCPGNPPTTPPNGMVCLYAPIGNTSFPLSPDGGNFVASTPIRRTVTLSPSPFQVLPSASTTT